MLRDGVSSSLPFARVDIGGGEGRPTSSVGATSIFFKKKYFL